MTFAAAVFLFFSRGVKVSLLIMVIDRLVNVFVVAAWVNLKSLPSTSS